MSLEDRTPTVGQLLPWLVKVAPDQKSGKLVSHLRKGFVANGRRSTYRIHADYPTDDPSTWMTPDALTNNVECLIDGEATYGAMLEAMATATDSDHWIILLGWSLRSRFVMGRSDRSPFGPTTFLDVVKDRLANHRCQIRILVFDVMSYARPPGLGELTETDDTGVIGPGAEIEPLEELVEAYGSRLQLNTDCALRSPVGSHHHKILLVRGSEGLVGFWGGIDLDPNRLASGSSGFHHDVHARVTGPAAKSLLSIAVARWNYGYNPRVVLRPFITRSGGQNTPAEYREKATWEDANLWKGPPEADRPRGFAVQFTQTVGNAFLTPPPPESDAWPAVQRLLNSAKRLIYVEEQYAWSLPFVDALAAAAKRGVNVLLLLPPYSWRPGPIALVRRALARLYQQAWPDGLKRIGIYHLAQDDHNYVHAKCGVIDDAVLFIGSMNQNNRGHFYDSEVEATVADLPWSDRRGSRAGTWGWMELDLAHKLRMMLWSEHLGLAPADVYDGVASLWRWPLSARVKRFTIGGEPWDVVVGKDDPVEDGPVNDYPLDPLPT